MPLNQTQKESGFGKLIRFMSPHQSVLDIGAAGLDGENTTDMLFEHFDEVTGVNIREDAVAEYRKAYPERDIIVGDYYTLDLQAWKDIDVLVLDLTIEKNLQEWSLEGLARASKFLDVGGTLISYVMMTTEYGDEDTSVHIKNHWRDWWESDKFDEESVEKVLNKVPGFKLIGMEREARRPYILWVVLQKNG